MQRAASGQLYNAAEKTLHFKPPPSLAARGSRLPWFAGSAAGMLIVGGAAESEAHTLLVTIGALPVGLKVAVDAAGRKSEVFLERGVRAGEVASISTGATRFRGLKSDDDDSSKATYGKPPADDYVGPSSSSVAGHSRWMTSVFNGNEPASFNGSSPLVNTIFDVDPAKLVQAHDENGLTAFLVMLFGGLDMCDVVCIESI